MPSSHPTEPSPAAPDARPGRLRSLAFSRPALLFAFAFAVIGLIIANYHELIGRFPEGGGAAAAAGSAFGEGWAFIPIGALIVDFVLTIAISVSAASSALIAFASQDQELVLFYAVSVFLSFLAGLLAMARFARREGRRATLALSLVGALVVAFVLAINLSRGDPIASLAASLLIAGVLWRLWVRAGRPRGIASAVVEAES